MRRTKVGGRGSGRTAGGDSSASTETLDELRPEQSEGRSRVSKGCSGRGDIQGTGLEAGTCFVHLKNNQEMIEKGWK